MSKKTEYCVVMTTCPTQLEADTHARAIIEKGLGACVQTSQIQSHYQWEGKVQTENEILMRIKTTCAKYSDVEAYLVAEHSYEVPQIIQLPITAGLSEYLDWVKKETK
ncbi:MAG: hypothetical protein B0D91_00660 [Oceanospirillales bacterium LUC14_002_19_P2]|nr:MAG: hypothetical protein B0D91_00660 [Oceanospirillales bacterium LUC14_002_19_P2]